ncbi:hypothetical protein [Streptomyces sp. NPDC001985]|uniref:hypothetical protein n=1 Tax=Streptomyces sp. NPDC001985 TaxID=3154406 RepID=UPI00332B9E56
MLSEAICCVTTNRRHALRAVTAQADLVPVLGSEHSSSSVPLVELTRKPGTPAHLIGDCSRTRPDWLRDAPRSGSATARPPRPHWFRTPSRHWPGRGRSPCGNGSP